MADKKYISELDTQRFGFKVAKVNDFDDNPKKILTFLKKSDVKLIISKINCSEIKLINQLENLGFRIKDSQVTYTYLLKNFKSPLNKTSVKSIEIQKYQKKDLKDIKMILKESFSKYGHYFADEKLDQNKCLDVYVDWGIRSCTERDIADTILIARFDKEIAGLLTFKKFKSGQSQYAAGGLGAVSTKYRGNDIFKMLAIKGLEWGIEQDLEWIEHNVLTNNYPVNNVFSTLGFKISNSFITMHCWV